MPPKTRRRITKNDTSGSNQPPAKGGPRAPAKTTTRQSKAAATKAASSDKKKFDLADFESIIRSQVDDFIDSMEEELRSSPSGLDMKTITKELTPDLGPILRCMTATTHRPTRDSDEAPHVKAIAMMNDLKDIIEEYQTAIKAEHRIKKPDWIHWSQDAEELRQVSQQAKHYAKEAIGHIVVPGLHPSSIKPPEAGGEVENVAWEVTEGCRPNKTEETWGMAASEQVQTFTKILKLLPGEQTSPR